MTQIHQAFNRGLRPNGRTYRLFLPLGQIRQAKKAYSTTIGGHANGSAGKQADWNANETLFRYTSGRWLFDEAQQLASRYIKFDMRELVSVAARAVGKPSSACQSVRKLGEGQFNKVYLLTMDDGSEVVAKVPNPNAGLPHYTTASEVATMEFARNVLKIPVPKVFAWNSRATTSSVRAEYIIMERVQGDSLAQHWPNMDYEDRNKVLQTIIAWESTFVAHPFCMYGNIYFPQDLSPEVLAAQEGHLGYTGFAIGPICNRYFFEDGRDSIETDRGPWRAIEEYLTAIAQREINAIRQLKRFPRPKFVAGVPGAYASSRDSKLTALHDYLKVVKYLVPLSKDLKLPVLWHRDLNLDNIFVNPSQPTEIFSIIDWQSSYVGPLFEQISKPAFIEFDGPRHQGCGVPTLPENFDDLSTEEKQRAKTLVGDQALYMMYEAALADKNKTAHRALRYRDTVVSAHIMALANIIFNEGGLLLLRNLMDVAKPENWEKIVGKSGDLCPLTYSASEVEAQRGNEEKWLSGVQLMDDLIESLGGVSTRAWDGSVRSEEYDEAKAMLDLVRVQFIEHHAQIGSMEERELWARAWPFKDSA